MEVLATYEENMRRALFTPCETKDQLATWIQVFTGFDLPDCTVSDESNSNPLEMIWEIYDKARRNEDDDFARVMAYASRGGFKTLGASILEVLQVLHLRRNVAHMAAIFDQSKKSQEYVRGIFSKPIIRDFGIGQNVKKIEICRYYDSETGRSLTEKEWTELSSGEKLQYERIHNYIQIVLCTMTGANSAHTEFFCVGGDTLVELGSGHKTPIKDLLVGQKVKAFNFDRRDSEAVRVIQTVKTSAPALKIELEDGKSLVCGLDHPLYSPSRGFVPSSSVAVGDRLVVSRRLSFVKTAQKVQIESIVLGGTGLEITCDEWDQIVLGSLMGDMGIYKKPTNNPYLKEQHSQAQKDYQDWKWSVISRKLKTRDIQGVSGYTGAPLPGKTTGCSPILLPYLEVRTSFQGIERMGPLGLAVWYSDDGCAGSGFRLSTEGWSEEQNKFLRDFLLTQFHLEVSVKSYTRDGKEYYYLRGGEMTKKKLAQICKDYIHPSMAYKFEIPSYQRPCTVCGLPFLSKVAGTKGRSRKVCSNPVCQGVRWLDMETVKVKAIQSLPVQDLYDFTLSRTHTYWANSFLSKQCVDEVDVVPKQHRPAYEEAKHIPDARGGMKPITLLTSTRKFSYGLVQHEITNSHETGLHVRHWNIVDITEPCPPTRHEPEKPEATYYINDSTLKHITEDDFKLLDETAKTKWYPKQGFAGCRKCPLFAACKGRLATHQKSRSKMLKPITAMINQFKQSSASAVQTQLLCRKPDESGLIYPKFNREVHVKTTKQIAFMLTGEPQEAEISKAQLLQLMVDKGARFYAGMDFGFSHNFATVVGAVFGQFMFVITVIAMPGLELDEKIAVCEPIRPFSPTIFGDPEAPSDIKTFRRKGFHMREWNKYKGSVKAGIEVVRMKLMPAAGDPQLFLLANDPGVELLAKRFEKYHFITDAAAQISEEPDDEDDDEMDALRYMVMNVFAPKGKLHIPSSKSSDISDIRQTISEATQPKAGQTADWMKARISALTGEPSTEESAKTVKKGRFVFDG